MLSLVILREIDFILPSETEFRQGDEREERCHDHHGEEMRVVGEMHRGELEGEQALDEQPRQVDALDTEEASGEHYDGKGADDRRDLSDSFIKLA